MQILSYLKNNVTSQKPAETRRCKRSVRKRRRRHISETATKYQLVFGSPRGFTILECILAVGILSSVLASLVGLQTSIIYVAQNSMDKLKAVWAMRQATSQIDYVLDAGGIAAIPEKSAFVWTGDKRFTVVVTRKDLNDIKPSQFLTTALKFYNLANPGGNEHSDVDQMLAPITQLLDNSPLSPSPGSVENTAITRNANQSNFVDVFVSVNWNGGSDTQTLADGLFLMDNNALSNLQLPNLGGGAGGGSGSAPGKGSP